MITKIKHPNGVVDNIITQQYEIGLYGIINNDPARQFAIDIKESTYHIKLRLLAIKTGLKIIGGDIIKYKGKQPINIFENENS